ncbi:MAG: beta-ketoacyl synthase N-terminal-like domain-containing protein [Planctomycetota bacterium]
MNVAAPLAAAAAATLAHAHVVGRGAVSCFGRGRQALADAIFAGNLGVLPRVRTAAWDTPTEVAAEFPADLFAALGGGPDLALRAAAAAAHEALAEAGVAQPDGIALVLASTKGDLSGVLAGEPGNGLGLPARLAERLARELRLGPVLGTVSCACASGIVALTSAARHLHAGTAERVLVVGVDVLHPFVMAGFGSLHALDHKACRPFDQARRGVSLGEAAAAILLSRRAAGSIASIVGHGGANDACHVTGPDLQGAGIALAASRAIAGAGLQSGDIDVLHLHGTATVANDATEAIGLGALFGGQTPPAFGTKGQTGHTLGASGVLETILTIEALQRGSAPANVGLERPDVDPALTLVRREQRLDRAHLALKVASGFGGVQAAVVVRA